MKPSPTSIHVYQYNDPKSHYRRFQVRDCLIQLVPSALPFSAPHRHLTPKLTQASKKFYLIHPRLSFVGFDFSWIWLFLIPTRDRHEMRSRLAPSHIQLGQLNFNSSLIDSKKDMHKFLCQICSKLPERNVDWHLQLTSPRLLTELLQLLRQSIRIFNLIHVLKFIYANIHRKDNSQFSTKNKHKIIYYA